MLYSSKVGVQIKHPHYINQNWSPLSVWKFSAGLANHQTASMSDPASPPAKPFPLCSSWADRYFYKASGRESTTRVVSRVNSQPSLTNCVLLDINTHFKLACIGHRWDNTGLAHWRPGPEVSCHKCPDPQTRTRHDLSIHTHRTINTQRGRDDWRIFLFMCKSFSKWNTLL